MHILYVGRLGCVELVANPSGFLIVPLLLYEARFARAFLLLKWLSFYLRLLSDSSVTPFPKRVVALKPDKNPALC